VARETFERAAASATDGMWPLVWMMSIAVANSNLKVAARTPRSGGTGGSLSLCLSRAIGFVRVRRASCRLVKIVTRLV